MLNNMQITAMLSNMGADIRMIQIQVGIILDLMSEGFEWDEDKKKGVGDRMQKAFEAFLAQVEAAATAPTILLPDGTQKPVLVDKPGE